MLINRYALSRKVFEGETTCLEGLSGMKSIWAIA